MHFINSRKKLLFLLTSSWPERSVYLTKPYFKPSRFYGGRELRNNVDAWKWCLCGQVCSSIWIRCQTTCITHPCIHMHAHRDILPSQQDSSSNLKELNCKINLTLVLIRHWILMTHHYKPFYELGQSNWTDWQTGLFVLSWKWETTIKHHGLSILISVYIVRQGQSGSFLPKTLVNLNLAFKCFEHIIILLLPLLWFTGGKKPTHISSKHSIFMHKEAVGHSSVPLGREDEILKSLLLFIDTRSCRSSR